MNSAKKAKRLDPVSRVRKRNSTSCKPASHNAVQGRASLLKNNKTLAVTLQETRCELSNYKAFFEESLECISKVKIAKSKMVQLSTALKDFVKAFDEALLSMEFDDSKWANFKVSPQSCKNLKNEMNPVFEVADEILHQNRSCVEENSNSECSTDHQVQVAQKILHGEKDDDPEISFKSPQKETDCCNLNSVALAFDSEIGEVEGNVDMKAKVHNLSQTVKTTKIPRCKILSVNLKSQKESKPINKACKQKSLERKHEVSELNFSRRKTFVVKTSSILKNSEPKDNLLEKDVETENMVNVNEMIGAPEDAFILKNKRKTFVKESSLKDSVFAANLNGIQDINSEININQGEVIQDDELIIKNNKRKTFVKKSSNKTVPNQNNDYQTTLPNKECTSVDSKLATIETENCENNDKSENFTPSSYLQSHMPHSKIDDVSSKNRREIEPTEAVTSLNVIVTSATSSEEIKDDDKMLTVNEPPSSEIKNVMKNIASETSSPVRNENNKMPIASEPSSSENKKEENVMKNIASETSSQEMNENNKALVANEPSSSENKMEQHVMKTRILRDCLELSDTDCEEISVAVRQSSRQKSYKAFLESSDSECEEIPIVESFSEKRDIFKTTPIRKQITNKKKKFVFDGKKRKSVLKKESICKIMKSQTDKTNAEISDSGVHKAICNDKNYVNNHKIDKKNAVHFELDELLNKKGHSDNTESDNVSITHSKKRKTKYIHDVPVENTYAEKKVDKSCKIKKSKQHLLKNVLDPIPVKTKKRNKKKYDYDNLNILKFSEEENLTVDTVIQYNGTEKESELSFPCKKTGENTYLVQAEIHPPPPSLNTRDDIKEVDKENEMLNLQNMQVAVVLEDVFKSNNIDILNLCDKESLYKRTVSLKVPLSASTSNITVEADQSIEKFRSDEAFETGNQDLHNDALLDVGGSGLQADAVLNVGGSASQADAVLNVGGSSSQAVLDSEKPRSRRRKEVNYKEPSIHTKMRRC